MDFKKYSSIENSLNKKTLENIYKYADTTGEFSVSEKVDGSNLSFWITPDGKIEAAKRSVFLTGENFYNYQTVLEKIRPQLLSILSYINDIHDDTVELVIVYGELFGGYYNHVDVKPDPNATKIQKRASYAQFNDFYAFDIRIKVGDDYKWLSVGECEEVFGSVCLLYAEPLFRGTFEDCLDFDINFVTRIPEIFGLPPIEGNICEGIVIVPVEPRFMPNNQRLILKKKNDKFGDRLARKQRVVEEIPENIKFHLEEVSGLISYNRYLDLVSKEGEFDFPTFGKAMGLFMKDVSDDYAKIMVTDEHSLNKKEFKGVMKKTSSLAAELLRKIFQDQTTG